MSTLQPALWEHVERTWQAMNERLASEPYEFDGHKFPLYRGFLSNLMLQELAVPVPYYGKVLRILTKMRCIQQVRRGGGPSPSEWVITGKPTFEAFKKVYDELPEQKARQGQRAAVTQQLSDIKKSLGGLDVAQALTDIATQVEILTDKYEDHLATYHDEVVA